jgi:hypothetical protein
MGKMSTSRILKRLSMAGLTLLVTWNGRAYGDFLFGTPTPLGSTVNSYDSEYDPDISADGLSLYFQSNRPGGYGDSDLYVTTRATPEDEWGEPVNLGPYINTPDKDFGPNISIDGLSLYFGSTRPGGSGGSDLYVVTRLSPSEPWGTPMNLGPTVNSSIDDVSPCISADGLSLYFSDWDQTGIPARPGGLGEADIWVTTRASLDDPWTTPFNLGAAVNSSSMEAAPDISDDGLMLFFSGYRDGSPWDLWVSVRDAVDAPWGAPMNLGYPANSTTVDLNPTFSADGHMLYFVSFRSGGVGGSDLWQAPVTPIVDFNGDGKVNERDVAIMLSYWGGSEPLCDIGPTPFGDGVIDGQDLIALADCIEKDVTDATLIAHWEFDEVEGDIAYDSVGVHDATLMGAARWLPGEGAVGGALQLDGESNYLTTGYVINPADQPFSVLAWVKGGAPGEVILSQQEGADWLRVDANGAAMTELCPMSRFGNSQLTAETVITDGQWHRIGFVWDGFDRILYIDDSEAARDAQSSLPSSPKGLRLGVGKELAPGSLFSGLVDDVRIYNRVVKP